MTFVSIEAIPNDQYTLKKFDMDRRYQSMDFLRAIAILLVLLSHAVLSYGSPSYLAPLQLGGTGVDLFFVLSGWLLGGQLFKEINRDGSIDIKRFWIRRWMRTLPAYYVVLIFSVTQRELTKVDVEFPIEYFFFLQNYNAPLKFFSISWSLCVEEQFYLIIAPLLTILSLRTKQYTTVILLFLVFLPSIFRYFDMYGYVDETHVRFDGCILGVLLAQMRYQYQEFWGKIIRFSLASSLVGLAIFILLILTNYFPNVLTIPRDKLLLACIFGSWVVLANSSFKWQQKLTFSGANYIATRSYAIYLLHPEVLAILKRYFLGVPFVIYLLFALLGSMIISEMLYRLVEKPIMDAREKFTLSKAKHFEK